MKTSNHLAPVRNLLGRLLLGTELHAAVKAVWLQRDTLLLGLLLRGPLAVSLLSCTPQHTEQQVQEANALTGAALPATARASGEALVKRGEYLVNVGGCNDCHTPKIMTPQGPQPDPDRILAGPPQHMKVPAIPNNANWISMSHSATVFVGSWGVSYAANLTPDETGIGTWSFKQFETALRKGKAKGIQSNRSLLPLMPWQNYKDMTDEDLRALFAYLQSIKPVENVVPQPVSPEELKNGQGNR